MGNRLIELSKAGRAERLWPSPTGQLLCVSSEQGRLSIVNVKSLTILSEVQLKSKDRILHVAWTEDDSQVCILQDEWSEYRFTTCDAPNLVVRRENVCHPIGGPFDSVKALSCRFNADGTRVAIDIFSHGYQCEVAIFDTASGQIILQYLFGEHESGEVPYLNSRMSLLCIGADLTRDEELLEAEPEHRASDSPNQYFDGHVHCWALKIVEVDTSETEVIRLARSPKDMENPDQEFGFGCFSRDETEFFAQPEIDGKVYVINTSQRRIVGDLDSRNFKPSEIYRWSVPHEFEEGHRFHGTDPECTFEIVGRKVVVCLRDEVPLEPAKMPNKELSTRPRIALELPDTNR